MHVRFGRREALRVGLDQPYFASFALLPVLLSPQNLVPQLYARVGIPECISIFMPPVVKIEPVRHYGIYSSTRPPHGLRIDGSRYVKDFVVGF